MAGRGKTRCSGRVVQRIVSGGSGEITLTGFYTGKVRGRNKHYAIITLKVPTTTFDGDSEETSRSYEPVPVIWPLTREVYRRLKGPYNAAIDAGKRGLTIEEAWFEADFSGMR